MFTSFFAPRGLAALVQKSGADAEVVVREDYSDLPEPLQITRPIKIRAANSTTVRHDIRIQAVGEVWLTGFVFEGEVEILAGKIKFEDCRFEHSRSSITATSTDSQVKAIRCHFGGVHDKHPIHAAKGARIEVVGSTFEQIEGQAAICVEGRDPLVPDFMDPQSRAEISGCQFRAMRDVAIFAADKAEVKLTECDFTDLATYVILSKSKARAQISASRVTSLVGYSFCALEGGRIAVEGCSFEEVDTRFAANNENSLISIANYQKGGGGFPLYRGYLMPFTGCPICGYPEFYELAPNRAPTYDICPCCRFGSGTDCIGWEIDERDRFCRQEWLAGGGLWWHGEPPLGWNVADQLRAAGLREDGGHRMRMTEERQRTLSKAISLIAEAQEIIEAFRAEEEAFLEDVRELIIYDSKENAVSSTIDVLDGAATALDQMQDTLTYLLN